MSDAFEPFEDPDGDDMKIKAVLSLFQNETGITIAWRDNQPAPSTSIADSLFEAIKDKLPPELVKQMLGDKGEMRKTINYADITIPVNLLLVLSKFATIGVQACGEAGLRVPMKSVEVNDATGEQRPGGVEGMMMSYFDDQDDAEKSAHMSMLTCGLIAEEGHVHLKAKEMAKMEGELATLEVPDSLPEGFGEQS